MIRGRNQFVCALDDANYFRPQMTLAEIYSKFAHECDKGTVHSYIDVYERLLAPYRKVPNARVLEVGIFKGGSLRMWELFFELGWVDGIDLCDQPLNLADLRPMIAEGSHNIHLFDASNKAQFDLHLGEGTRFDVVIEDASHALSQQLSLFVNIRPRMRPGGLYVIEDVENIDRDRTAFENLDPTCRIEIIDRRHLKDRFDDVLVVVHIP